MFNKNKIKKIIAFALPLSILFFVVTFAFAETKYAVLETLGGNIKDEATFSEYISGLFKLSMGLAVVLAVFQISYGGFLYITSDSFTQTSLGRKKVQAAVTGLLILLTSYLLLNTINPDLVNLNFEIPEAKVKTESSSGGG